MKTIEVRRQVGIDYYNDELIRKTELLFTEYDTNDLGVSTKDRNEGILEQRWKLTQKVSSNIRKSENLYNDYGVKNFFCFVLFFAQLDPLGFNHILSH